MGLSVGADDGVPKVDASLGTCFEQVACGEQVVVDGVEALNLGGVKRVQDEAVLDDQGVQDSGCGQALTWLCQLPNN